MDSALLVLVAALQIAILGLLLHRSRAAPPSFVDVSAKLRSGPLPGGAWQIEAGMRGEPILESGALVIAVRSKSVWVHEVWVRTDYGWAQLQPGPGEGMFRNTLVAGLRISTLRLWLAPAGSEPDPTTLVSAAGLLVPAALLLSFAQRHTPLAAPLRSQTPPTDS